MNIQILGLGKYLPTEKIENSFFASHFGLSEDDIFRQSGVRTRHRADRTSGETTVKMGAIAIENACASAGVALDELDLIVNVSAIGAWKFRDILSIHSCDLPRCFTWLGSRSRTFSAGAISTSCDCEL